MKKITITGSEGLLGKEISKFLEKNNRIYRLDLKLGHDLNDEKFVKKWFKKNHSDYLINCFAINDHVSETKRKNNLFNFPLETFSQYLQTNVTTLFSVCREFARNNKKSGIINFSSTSGSTNQPFRQTGSNKLHWQRMGQRRPHAWGIMAGIPLAFVNILGRRSYADQIPHRAKLARLTIS